MKDEGKRYVAQGRRKDGTEYAGVERNNYVSASQDALDYAADPETTMAWVDEIRVKRMFLVETEGHPKRYDDLDFEPCQSCPWPEQCASRKGCEAD